MNDLNYPEINQETREVEPPKLVKRSNRFEQCAFAVVLICVIYLLYKIL